MEILKITKADIQDGKYIKGAVDFDGHVEIDENLGYVFFASLKATGYIYAKAGSGIEAGCGIEAGEGIEAGNTINVKLRIFAGLIIWRKPEPSEMGIRCKRLESGEICYGTLIETGSEVKNGK